MQRGVCVSFSLFSGNAPLYGNLKEKVSCRIYCTRYQDRIHPEGKFAVTCVCIYEQSVRQIGC
jgi:hypothetical protein